MGKTKAVTNVGHVDLENGIVYGCLKQIRSCKEVSIDPDSPPLIEAWCCAINPAETPTWVSLIRDYVDPFDKNSLLHIKRFNQIKDSENADNTLHMILCTKKFLPTKERLLDFLSTHAIELDFKIKSVSVPSTPPQSKEISQKWSKNYWPMSWKGNPNHQFLNNVQIDIETEKYFVNLLVDKTISLKMDKMHGSMIVKPGNGKIGKILAFECSSMNATPFEHSIMKAIDTVAIQEKKRRLTSNNDENESIYLCQNLAVYTTHEPCVMCSMALVHSRIARIIYLNTSPRSGGLESNYQLGDRDGLNWKFEIWKWIGKEELRRFSSQS